MLIMICPSFILLNQGTDTDTDDDADKHADGKVTRLALQHTLNTQTQNIYTIKSNYQVYLLKHRCEILVQIQRLFSVSPRRGSNG